jgi:RNA polymerase sigma factor (sigma-70 family)
MTATANEFEQLMQRVRAGCPEAAREVFERYSEHVRRVVRRWLHHRLRPQYDSLDFIQSVWTSFFRVPAQRYTFRTADELIGFLSRVAYFKVIDVFRRRLQTDKHHGAREDPFPANKEGGTIEPAAVRQPTPSQLAIAQEHWERLLQGQPPQVCRALEMLRRGHTHREVADCLGVTPKMIQRLLQSLRRKLDLS